MPAETVHPDIRQPENDQAVVWRYMTHDKLVSLLSEKALYFASLGQVDDQHEGSLPAADWHWLRENVANAAQWSETRRNSLLGARISCWSMKHHESDALWRLYAHGHRSVAIRTTYARLRDSVSDVPPFAIHIGLIAYKDFRTAERTHTVNVFAPVYWKRIAFEYESEVRLAGYFYAQGVYEAPPGIPPSHFVPCDLEALVTAIVVGPYAGAGYRDEVLAAVQCHAPALQSRVVTSELDTSPLF